MLYVACRATWGQPAQNIIFRLPVQAHRNLWPNRLLFGIRNPSIPYITYQFTTKYGPLAGTKCRFQKKTVACFWSCQSALKSVVTVPMDLIVPESDSTVKPISCRFCEGSISIYFRAHQISSCGRKQRQQQLKKKLSCQAPPQHVL